MTPLQDAATAARENGLNLPSCPECSGRGERLIEECGHVFDVTCAACAGCGADTSEPDLLLGRAMRLTAVLQGDVQLEEFGISCWAIREPHDGTPESAAEAALWMYVRSAV